MICSQLIRIARFAALLATGAAFTAEAQAPAVPPPLPAETSDVAVLPAAGPHWVFVMGSFRFQGASIIDADDAALKIVGTLPMQRGVMTITRDASRIFVAETFYSRGNRGTREDVLAVYDGATLNLVNDIVLPGRLQIGPRTNLVEVSEDAGLAYIYDMVPASNVHVIDIGQGKLLTSVDLPGCSLALPFGKRGFASICGDGTIGVTQVPESGTAKVIFSKPFFDANLDPLFENSVIDKASGEAWFLSYTGKIFPAKLGSGAPLIGKPWSVSAAAGFPVAGTGVQDLAWRPGGAGQMLALHRASKQLYVLMHTGNHWTHKAAGTEVWVLDTARQTLIRRINLQEPSSGIAVSQDDKPLLYAVSEGKLAVLDAITGQALRDRRLPASLMWVPGL